jgi:hypothetical protein
LQLNQIAPFANGDNKIAFQEVKELELAASMDGRWREDIVPGRFEWWARGMRLCDNPDRSRSSVNAICATARRSCHDQSQHQRPNGKKEEHDRRA